MKERPVIFSAPMVRALLEGRKTQTRRIVKLKKNQEIYRDHVFVKGELDLAESPYGQPGDRLWVKENGWQPKVPTPRELREGADTWPNYEYDADGLDIADAETFKEWGWKRRPSIFMPRWASRILLEITGVRVERLQNISEEDARAEGIEDGGCLNCGEAEDKCKCNSPMPDARDSFIHLWETINGAGSWNVNPFVWIISFKRIER